MTNRKSVLAAAILSLLILSSPTLTGEVEGEGGGTEAELPASSIAGRVTDADGRPVAGARVLGVSAEARPVRKPAGIFGDGPGKPKQLPIAESTTDEEGRFEIEIKGSAPFMLRADADGFAPGQVFDVNPKDPVTLALSTGWSVEGHVLDRAAGKPLAGVEVEIRPRITGGFHDEDHPDRFASTAKTDDRGRFRIEHLDANYYYITAIAEGYTRASVPGIEIGLDDRPSDPVYLYVEPGVELQGHVVDAEGAPVSGARVHVRPERIDMGKVRRWARTGGLTEKTDENGKFELRGVPPAPSYQVEASHDDHATAWLTGIEVRPGRSSAPLEIRLGQGTSLTAKLVAGGKPFAGKVSAGLVYTDRGGGQFKPRISRSAEEVPLESGRLTLSHLPPGKATVKLSADGYEPIEREGVTLPEDRALDLGEILLEPGLRIAGKVLGQDGKPLSGAAVEITAIAPGRFERSETKTGEDGRFTAGGLKEMPYTVTAGADGYGRASKESVEPGGEPVLLELERAGAIRGRVLAGDPRRPVRGFAVTPQGTATPGLPFQMQAVMQSRARLDYRDGSGEFLVEGLTGDTYSLKVEASGFIATRVEKVEVAPGETVDVGDVLLERGVTIQGVVTEKGGGRPVGGASVILEDPGLFNMGEFMNFDRATEITGPDGRFSLHGLAPGRHTVKVEHEKYSPGKKEIEIAAGVPPEALVVELGHGGAIEGTYRDADGKPVNGGMIMAMLGFTPSPNAMASSDEVGHYRIDNLTPGTYRVMAMGNPIEAQGDQEALMAGMQMQTVEVVDGKTEIVNFPAESGRITVNGVVRKGSERIEARMFWVRMSADETSAEDLSIGMSDESGSYQVRLNEPGEYRVSVQPVGSRDELGIPAMTLKVEIPGDSENVMKDIVIPEIVLSGTVVDADTGQPLRDARVLALEHRTDRSLAESIAASSATSDEHGAYRLEGITEGEYKLVFSKDGYGAETLGPIEVEDGEEEGLNAALTPASPVKLKVVDESGNPVEGALVYALSGPVMAVSGGAGETDMNGEATLTGLTDGTHDLGILATGLAPAIAAGVEVHEEVEEPAVVELRRGARVTVRVLDAEERPVSGAAVRVRVAQGADLSPLLQLASMLRGRGMITGSDGTLEIANLAAGRYEVEARWEQFTSTEKLEVRLDRENVIEIDLR